MPRPPLSAAEQVQLAQLAAQGLRLQAIAKQLGVNYRQVQRAVKRLGIAYVRDTPGMRPITRDLSPAQLALMARFAQSGIHPARLAERLGVGWRLVSRELRGRQLMAATRLAALDKLLPPLLPA